MTKKGKRVSSIAVRDVASVLGRYGADSAGLTKYAKLGKALLRAIEDGVWKAGEKLPTEVDLAEATPYSLGTVQRAYRFLVERGAVVRVHGSGSFVAEGRQQMDAPWHCRFLGNDGDGYLPVYTKVLSRSQIADTGPWSEFLGQSGKNVLRIDRKISINDEFDVYSKFFANAERFHALLTKPVRSLEGMNFKAMLDEEFGTPVTRLRQNLVIADFPSEVRRALNMSRSRVGGVMNIFASTEGGAPVYYQELFIPPNPRKLYITDIIRR